MLLDSRVYIDDIQKAMEMDFPWDRLKGKSILITGANGMIGSCLVDILLYRNRIFQEGIEIYALGRSKEKLEQRFLSGKNQDVAHLHIVVQDISQPLNLESKIDFIIHAASNANPYMFAKYPVDTLIGNVIGMENLLKFAVSSQSERVLYVSSGEMYGQADDTVTNGFTEDYCGYVDYSSPRACYPSGKRAAETLCQCYAEQYGMEVVIARPCHCYGPTMTLEDTRAMSQFFRKVLNGEDIVLKSDGSLERSHCYVVDAAMAILWILICGDNRNAFNIADPDSQATVKALAECIAEAGGQKIVFDLPDTLEKKGFSPVQRAVLNADKILKTGWKPITHLADGARKTLCILKEAK
ncbi:NAD-dependent epimerase/dehydratase family protein [Konateibacter massiliensis]|uniref:NAD-dependent epimerase/dehydratase family protein n=1 Tax=Konateibacter massiliensis TaxID=2002841 RepID=UPI000C16060F|nr:NAD-dependent epimerase/dehydratase family protein [Konateibacter massiliensis]